MDKKILEWATLCSKQTATACSMCDLPSSTNSMACEERFAKAIVDHFERYRWHDLREDPNDLPSVELSECLVRELWEDGDITYDVVYVTYVHDYAGTGVEPDIVAWKEIEP